MKQNGEHTGWSKLDNRKCQTAFGFKLENSREEEAEAEMFKNNLN